MVLLKIKKGTPKEIICIKGVKSGLWKNIEILFDKKYNIKADIMPRIMELTKLQDIKEFNSSLLSLNLATYLTVAFGIPKAPINVTIE